MTTKTELRTLLDNELAKINADPNTSNYLDYDQRAPYVTAILTLLEDTVREVIGPENAFIATDDLIKDRAVSWAIQMRVKAKQRQRLVELKEQGRASSRPAGSDVRTDTNNGEESR